ncbi:hypothetical protein EMIHUDRAFT_217796 [Emiliania huxleyi CCMP1516]|uniref:TIR domain-containing protein n=2 Tax=Emiliania huxleyi TaxID=2903 RepID=A0A0D3IAC3_EMIH1|nr:hypothetical protein EMIHUDRAFT_217796 [Emiliania huxleyi CCMP1516]EOD08208.1 hypothetical protein EMIHUDRAFT_217796 [Emiliania huxleyi CCMP1516]|eukprot:XP_005760637.1 hypothetical protein EMIHUDRAFT_217796 [Emiliania huxleyi CCMP1516]
MKVTKHLLPDSRVFLDVYDLKDIDTLEQHIRESALVVVILTRGYFRSKATDLPPSPLLRSPQHVVSSPRLLRSQNCMRELRSAIEEKKPLLLIQELDEDYGGIPLASLVSDCPDDLRSILFTPERVCGLVPWSRKPDFQSVALTAVCQAILAASGNPKYAVPPRVEIPGSLGTRPLSLSGRTTFWCSRHNFGAFALAQQLAGHLHGDVEAGDDGCPTSAAVGGGAPGEDRRAWAVSLLQRAVRQLLNNSVGTPVMFLRLSKKMFRGEARRALPSASPLGGLASSPHPPRLALAQAGERLEADILRAMERGIQFALVFPTTDRFSEIIDETPQELLQRGLYKNIAIDFTPWPPHERITAAQLALTLGAKEDDTRRAWRRSRGASVNPSLERRSGRLSRQFAGAVFLLHVGGVIDRPIYQRDKGHFMFAGAVSGVSAACWYVRTYMHVQGYCWFGAAVFSGMVLRR